MSQSVETVDSQTVEFTKRIGGDIAGLMLIRMSAIGERLGLFKDLAENGPATSEELAARTGLDERYVREWLGCLSAAGYLDHDKKTDRHSIPPEHVPVLADDTSRYYMGGMLRMMTGAMKPYDQLIEAFKSGGGLDFSTYDDDLWSGMERHTCVRYRNLLIEEWMPLMPDVEAKLNAGATMADLGCGRGHALIRLAKMYPNARFFGFDVFEPNIKLAKDHAREAGVEDRVTFQARNFVEGLPDTYDVISTFDVIHDMARPREGLKAIRKALKDDGIYIVLEIVSEDDPADNVGLTAAIKYGISVHFCMTTSLAQGGAGLGTLGMPEARVREYCNEAGFSSVRRLPFDDPFNCLYEVRA